MTAINKDTARRNGEHTAEAKTSADRATEVGWDHFATRGRLRQGFSGDCRAIEYAWNLFTQHLTVLRWWAGRSLSGVREHEPATRSWSAVAKFIGLLEDFGRSRSAEFRDLLSRSNEYLAPLSDPLTCELGLHAWLRPEREESYSMWLQWSLQQLGDWESLSKVLGLTGEMRDSSPGFVVERELTIPYRDGSGYGRLDLVIKRGLEILCVLEVKTRSFSSEDLHKQRSYSEYAPHADRIFLSTDPAGFDLHGFRPLSWADLCIRLRGAAIDIAAKKNCLTAGLLLAFVGAVEQNLLGLAQSDKDNPALPRTVEHLRQFLDRSNYATYKRNQ